MQERPVFNILDFGAIGNAKTENSAAIQKVIDNWPPYMLRLK